MNSIDSSWSLVVFYLVIENSNYVKLIHFYSSYEEGGRKNIIP